MDVGTRVCIRKVTTPALHRLHFPSKQATFPVPTPSVTAHLLSAVFSMVRDYCRRRSVINSPCGSGSMKSLPCLRLSSEEFPTTSKTLPLCLRATNHSTAKPGQDGSSKTAVVATALMTFLSRFSIFPNGGLKRCHIK